jgi:hypothetical protein
MPAPTPARGRDVYFVGAGLSSAAGLPNTPSLIESVLTLAQQRPWLLTERLAERLKDAFRFFYPDAEYEGFRPGVVDFFSALRTFLDVGSGFPGDGFTDAPELYRVLKLAIANVLIEKLREVSEAVPGPGLGFSGSVRRNPRAGDGPRRAKSNPSTDRRSKHEHSEQ